MNDHQNNPRRKMFDRGSRRHSVDGISRRPAAFTATDNINFRRPISYRPSAEQTVGNFNQPEGYHASDQGKIVANPDADENIFQDASKPKHRHLSLRRKPKNPKRGGAEAKTSKLKIFAKVLAVFFALVLLLGSFLFIKGYIKARHVFKGGTAGAAALQDNVDPSLLRGEGDGRINILVLGKGGEGYTAPDLTDTILIVSIDPLHKETAILSIPRDLYVKTPTDGATKINAVYAFAKQVVLASGKQTSALQGKAEKAGFAAIEKVITDTMGIPIHYHVMIDFTGFKKAVDTVGGVDLNAPASVYENMLIDGRPYILNVKPGYQHFDGFRALAYARSRYTSPRGDFDRAERQRLLLVALKDKIVSAGTYANPIKISQLLDAFGDHVETNMTIDEILRLYDISKGITSDKITSIGLADPPNNYVTTAFIDNQSVVVPRAGVFDFSEIQSFIRNTIKDSFIKDENAGIMVLNGTSTAGLATSKADELKSYGYRVVQIGDAPTKTYQKTVLVDLTNGTKKYTRHYLEQRFGVSATTQLPDSNINVSGADFVVILGQ